MSDSRDLRKQAVGCRRAARIRTEGGGMADRALIALATRLEHEADELDHAHRREESECGALRR